MNDTYRTDLCLLYPPFMIALACLHVACVVQQKDARQWFAELSVDMEKVLFFVLFFEDTVSLYSPALPGTLELAM